MEFQDDSDILSKYRYIPKRPTLFDPFKKMQEPAQKTPPDKPQPGAGGGGGGSYHPPGLGKRDAGGGGDTGGCGSGSYHPPGVGKRDAGGGGDTGGCGGGSYHPPGVGKRDAGGGGDAVGGGGGTGNWEDLLARRLARQRSHEAPSNDTPKEKTRTCNPPTDKPTTDKSSTATGGGGGSDKGGSSTGGRGQDFPEDKAEDREHDKRQKELDAQFVVDDGSNEQEYPQGADHEEEEPEEEEPEEEAPEEEESEEEESEEEESEEEELEEEESEEEPQERTNPTNKQGTGGDRKSSTSHEVNIKTEKPQPQLLEQDLNKHFLILYNVEEFDDSKKGQCRQITRLRRISENGKFGFFQDHKHDLDEIRIHTSQCRMQIKYASKDNKHMRAVKAARGEK